MNADERAAREALVGPDTAQRCRSRSPEGVWECKRYAGHPGWCCAVADDPDTTTPAEPGGDDRE